MEPTIDRYINTLFSMCMFVWMCVSLPGKNGIANWLEIRPLQINTLFAVLSLGKFTCGRETVIKARKKSRVKLLT